MNAKGCRSQPSHLFENLPPQSNQDQVSNVFSGINEPGLTPGQIGLLSSLEHFLEIEPDSTLLRGRCVDDWALQCQRVG